MPDDTPASVATPAAPARKPSILSTDLAFEGAVSGAGDLQVDGAIKGDVRVGRLIVGEPGSIDGNVSAEYVEVRGRIVGAVSGKQVRLIATAYVDGDITAEQLSIDIGAYFQGRVLQSRRDAPAAAPASAPTQAQAMAPAPATAQIPTFSSTPAASQSVSDTTSALEKALSAVPLRSL